MSNPRHIIDPEHILCEEMVTFAPFGSAVLDPEHDWVDES